MTMPSRYHIDISEERARLAGLPEIGDFEDIPDPAGFRNLPLDAVARLKEIGAKVALVVALFYITYLGASQLLH